MLKVCIDTNIWISGLIYSGPPSEIVGRALKKRFQVIALNTILNELEKNLTSKFGLKTKTAKRLIYRIAEVSDLYEPLGEIKFSTLSRGDNLVLETALLGKSR